MQQKYGRWAQLAFWLLYLLKDILMYVAYHKDYPTSWLLIVPAGYLLTFMTAFYGGYRLIFTYIVQTAKRSIGRGVWRIVATFVLIVLARYVVEFGFLKPVVRYDNYSHNMHFTWTWFVQNALLYYWSWVLYGVLYGFVEQYIQRQQREREQMKAEVSLLRAQVNPHFLFNVLNDLYALALTQPNQTPDALLKLSDLLRYMLYTSDVGLVPLSEEIEYIKSYIDLEQIGQKGKVNVKTSFVDVLPEWKIAPMLLIPFVENAFKHGVLFDPTQAISVRLAVENGLLLFRCCNSKRQGAKDATGGIGLLNLQRRLDLEYPNRYTLDINNTATVFDVQLRLAY